MRINSGRFQGTSGPIANRTCGCPGMFRGVWCRARRVRTSETAATTEASRRTRSAMYHCQPAAFTAVRSWAMSDDHDGIQVWAGPACAAVRGDQACNADARTLNAVATAADRAA